MSKTDWTLVEQEYITSPEGISYRELARKHGLDQATVSRHGKRGEWVAKREAHRRQTASRALAKIEEKASSEYAEVGFNTIAALVECCEILTDLIRSRTLTAKTLDAAVNALVSAIKMLEVLRGNPDSRQQNTVTVRPPAMADERVNEFYEDIFVLGARTRGYRSGCDADGE